jgi:hypothetical protein
VTCMRQAVPLALSSFEWTPSSLPTSPGLDWPGHTNNNKKRYQ